MAGAGSASDTTYVLDKLQWNPRFRSKNCKTYFYNIYDRETFANNIKPNKNGERLKHVMYGQPFPDLQVSMVRILKYLLEQLGQNTILMQNVQVQICKIECIC